jgi:hypothetical protein
MTIVVALTYPGGAVVASDSRRVEANGQTISSEHFPKVFRRDWDYPHGPADAHPRFVLGCLAGQVMVGHRRMTCEVENECTAVTSRDDLARHLSTKLSDQAGGGWIVDGGGIDLLFVAKSDLRLHGGADPAIVHVYKEASQRHAVRQPLPRPDRSAKGSGEVGIRIWFDQQVWANEQQAVDVAREAITRAITWSNNDPQGCRGCGGEVCLQKWEWP